MSTPVIPSIKPDSVMTFDEAMRMLTASTAAQAESLTKLADIERERVTYIIKSNGVDAQGISESVEEILGTIEKFQVLLALKEEQIQQVTVSSVSRPELPVRASESVSDQGILTQRYSVPQLREPDPRSCAAAQRPCANQSGLIGLAKGSVANPEDAVYGENAALRAFIPSVDVMNRSIRYTAGETDSGIYFYAYGRNVSVQNDARGQNKTTRFGCCWNGLVISGEGTVRFRRPDIPDRSDLADCTAKAPYVLTVQNAERGLKFRMQIAASGDCPAYDSGWVAVKDSVSNLCMRICC
ncbi:MAG TPA: hypothetical protein PK629_06600 [Oscillospiraceae bacterium]|nr:hypothetical protein [Oscillospiraceae bacterium]HPF55932.1 hypothetical protein [Clostridiales bacterium]HPK36113.1 hypothetical protein [Oscillospiraceae bacterium]HPR76563.1 hypothetical protein [Oscillospiraceae bacterium]